MYWYRSEYYVNGELKEEDHSDRCVSEKIASKLLVETIKQQYEEWIDEFGKENISLKPMSIGSDVYVLKNLATGVEFRYWSESCR